MARARVLALYRDWYRSVSSFLTHSPVLLMHGILLYHCTAYIEYFWTVQAPEICATFGLNVSPNDIRRAVRAEFEHNRYITDPKVIDVLLVKGQQSYQETVNAWSQEPHILGILLAPKTRPQRTFMEKFLEGACFPRSIVCCSLRFLFVLDVMLMKCTF